MTEQPRRPRGQPRKPDAPTATQRKAASRSARHARAVELSADTLARLDAYVARRGLLSRAAGVDRLLGDAGEDGRCGSS